VIDPSMVDAIKSDPHLSFDAFTAKSFFSDFLGYEVLRRTGLDDTLLRDTVRIQLNRHLTKVTRDLATEVSRILDERWGQSEEWHDTDLGTDSLQLVATLSTRVFLGEELARNQEWLDIAINFTIDIFGAARKLRDWPAFLRPLVNLLSKSGRDLRASGKRASEIIQPIVDARRIARSNPGWVQPVDSLEWFEEQAKGVAYSETLQQLNLTMAAIHTTADLTKTALLAFAQHPEVVEEIRQELIEIMPNGGWDKVTMYKLRLLDSSIKEAQRLKPISLATMNRTALEDITLPDGTFLPKNADILVPSHSLLDEKLFPDPERYDAHRFIKIRSLPGNENKGQLTTTENHFLAFGRGKHECPGRFFAANEVKIAMAYALMNYDIRLKGNEIPKPVRVGFEYMAPAATIQVRRRKAEIDLDLLE